LKQQRPLIDYRSKVLLLGSCFVDNIGQKLTYFKFQSQSNPFGILFHPTALERMISRITQGTLFVDQDLFWHRERWQSLELHSSYSDTDKERLRVKLNQNITLHHKGIKEVSHIVITLGTAWGYMHLESQVIVGN